MVFEVAYEFQVAGCKRVVAGVRLEVTVMARTSPVRRPDGRAKDQNGSSGTKKKTAKGDSGKWVGLVQFTPWEKLVT